MNQIVFYDQSGGNAEELRSFKYDPGKVPQKDCEVFLDGTFYRVKDVRWNYDNNEIQVFLK